MASEPEPLPEWTTWTDMFAVLTMMATSGDSAEVNE
jgi:hypothetical protein